VLPANRRSEAKGGDDASAAKFFTIGVGRDGRVTLASDGVEAGALAFDHDEILASALARLEARKAVLVPSLFGRAMTPEEVTKHLEDVLGRRG
jgi:8-oxo-dGTP diphosphatase